MDSLGLDFTHMEYTKCNINKYVEVTIKKHVSKRYIDSKIKSNYDVDAPKKNNTNIALKTF